MRLIVGTVRILRDVFIGEPRELLFSFTSSSYSFFYCPLCGTARCSSSSFRTIKTSIVLFEKFHGNHGEPFCHCYHEAVIVTKINILLFTHCGDSFFFPPTISHKINPPRAVCCVYWIIIIIRGGLANALLCYSLVDTSRAILLRSGIFRALFIRKKKFNATHLCRYALSSDLS